MDTQLNKINYISYLKSKNLYIFVISISLLALSYKHVIEFGPWNRLGGELYSAFYKSRLNGSAYPLLIMDACPTNDFSLPYCGWPPLYGALLYLVSLCGLDYFLSIYILNFCIIVIFGLIWDFLLRLINPSLPRWFIFCISVFSTAFASNLSTAFAHMLIPMSYSLLLYSAILICKNRDTISFAKCVCLSAFSALFAGMANWASYFGVAIIFFCFVFDYYRTKKFFSKSTLKFFWSFVFQFLTFVLVAISLKLMNHSAFLQNDAIIFRSGMGGTQLITKLLPSINNIAQAIIYTIMRFAIAAFTFIPLFLMLIRRADMRRSNMSYLGPLAGLVISPILFCVFLSGEQSNSENSFHSMIWICPVFAILVFLDFNKISAKYLALFTTWCVAIFFVVVYGHLLLPSQFKSFSSNLPLDSQLFRSPGSSEQYNPRTTLIRSVEIFVKQIFPLRLEERYAKWHGNSPWIIVSQIKDKVDQNAIIGGFNLIVWNYNMYAKSPYVYLDEYKASTILHKIKDLKLNDRFYLIAPTGKSSDVKKWLHDNGVSYDVNILEVSREK